MMLDWDEVDNAIFDLQISDDLICGEIVLSSYSGQLVLIVLLVHIRPSACSTSC